MRKERRMYSLIRLRHVMSRVFILSYMKKRLSIFHGFLTHRNTFHLHNNLEQIETVSKARNMPRSRTNTSQSLFITNCNLLLYQMGKESEIKGYLRRRF